LIGNDTLLLDTPFPKQLREKAETDGYSKGKEDGKEDGKELGMREGLLLSIDLALEKHFGIQGSKLIPKIHAIQSIDVIKAIFFMMQGNVSLDDIREAASL